MRLHESFIRTAKQYEKKIAVIDRATNQRVTYRAVLLRALILAEKLKSHEKGFIGIMVPSSAGCLYAMLAVLMSGRTPVMINYSTGAAENCRDAQQPPGLPHDPHVAGAPRSHQVPDGRGDDLPGGHGEDRRRARQDQGRHACDGVGRPDHRPPPPGRRRRNGRHPVHQREREGAEGRPALAREHLGEPDGHRRGARLRPRRRPARQSPVLPRVRPDGESLAPARARDDDGDLPEPARVPVDLQRGARREGDGDGRHAGLPDRLRAEVGARRLRHGATAHHRGRQVPGGAAARLVGEARRHPVRGLRHDRDESRHLGQHAVAQPPGFGRQGAARTSRSGSSTTTRARRAPSTRSARCWSRARA